MKYNTRKCDEIIEMKCRKRQVTVQWEQINTLLLRQLLHL